ncbi:MAG: hypothetical protein GY861_12545 [bacterium]|nr:hypothetical protein [bacterium]
MSDETLTFKTEAERSSAFAAIQDKDSGATPEDMDEIDRITAAEIVGEEAPQEPSPAGDVVEPEAEAQPAPAPELADQPTDDARNWTITEEMIQKHDEEYTDESGRKRPFITHKNPDDLFKSYIGAQKNNHYLKTVKGPQDIKAAEERGRESTKAEYESKIAALQKDFDELKAKPATVPTEQPAPVQNVTDSIQQYNETLERINKVDEGDEIENIDLYKKAIVLNDKIRQEDSAKYADDIKKITADLEAKITNVKTEWETGQAAIKQEAEQNAAYEKSIQNTKNRHADIDVFAADKDVPAELKTGQKFSEMHKEAMAFHDQLAQLNLDGTGKSASNYTQSDWVKMTESAGNLYLNGSPELVAKANQYGIVPPKNYKTWVKLDQIDAIRTGWVRNAQTNNWERRYNPVTGNPVDLGDMKTAYNWYLDQTGERDKQIKADKDKNINQFANAVNKRDQGVVQLDDKQMDQDGDTLTEVAAQEIVNSIPIEDALQAHQEGKPEKLAKLNAALFRLDPEYKAIVPK